MLDFLEGQDALELVERDDGLIAPSGGPAVYFSEPTAWSPQVKEALERARGRVLDVGCGAGRIALYLQESGLEVVGVDISPGAVEVARRRGVRDARVMAVTELGQALGRFDTVVMMGNNFGLFGNRKRARWLLRRFHRLTTESGRIIAESVDPYDTEEEIHLAYHRRNRERGRMSGQVRIRVRYGRLRTPWFDYLLVSEEEMRALVDGTGWRIEEVLAPEEGAYTVVIGKSSSR
jgi:SAM-dependent methyltransferase